MTTSQIKLQTIVQNVVLDSSIIDIKADEEGIPNFWADVHQNIRDRSRANDMNICSKSDALKWFQDYKKQLTKNNALRGTDVPVDLREEVDLLPKLIDLLEFFNSRLQFYTVPKRSWKAFIPKIGNLFKFKGTKTTLAMPLTQDQNDGMASTTSKSSNVSKAELEKTPRRKGVFRTCTACNGF